MKAISVIIVEGLFLYNIDVPEGMFDLKVFIDTPTDIRFIRRLVRDRNERGRTVESIVNQYLATVRPMHNVFVFPNKAMADIVFNGFEYEAEDIETLARSVKQVAWLC
jgi:uridine kinase